MENVRRTQLQKMNKPQLERILCTQEAMLSAAKTDHTIQLDKVHQITDEIILCRRLLHEQNKGFTLNTANLYTTGPDVWDQIVSPDGISYNTIHGVKL